jgi:hypothetical protein
MKAKAIPHLDKLVDDGSAADRGYSAWKKARVETAKAEATDRSTMVAAETVWKRLGCDD